MGVRGRNKLNLVASNIIIRFSFFQIEKQHGERLWILLVARPCYVRQSNGDNTGFVGKNQKARNTTTETESII